MRATCRGTCRRTRFYFSNVSSSVTTTNEIFISPREYILFDSKLPRYNCCTHRRRRRGFQIHFYFHTFLSTPTLFRFSRFYFRSKISRSAKSKLVVSLTANFFSTRDMALPVFDNSLTCRSSRRNLAGDDDDDDRNNLFFSRLPLSGTQFRSEYDGTCNSCAVVYRYILVISYIHSLAHTNRFIASGFFDFATRAYRAGGIPDENSTRLPIGRYSHISVGRFFI